MPEQNSARMICLFDANPCSDLKEISVHYDEYTNFEEPEMHEIQIHGSYIKNHTNWNGEGVKWTLFIKLI